MRHLFSCFAIACILLLACDFSEKPVELDAYVLETDSTFLDLQSAYYTEPDSILISKIDAVLAENELSKEKRSVYQSLVPRALRRSSDSLESLIQMTDSLINESAGLGTVELLFVKGIIQYRTSAFEEAEMQYKRALGVLASLQKTSSLASAHVHNAYGILLDEIGDLQGALSQYKRALHDWENTGQADFMQGSIILNNLGIVSRKLGLNDEALAYYLGDVQLQVDNGATDKFGLAISYYNIGASFLDRGDYRQAIDFNLKALPTFIEFMGEEHGDIALVYNNLGGAYQNLGDFEAAQHYLSRSLAIKRTYYGDNHQEVAYGLSSMANLFINKKEFAKAITLLNEALQIREELFGLHSANLISVYEHLAQAYLGIRDFKKALEFEKTSRDMIRVFIPSNKKVLANSLSLKGQILKEQGDFDQADIIYEQALSELRETRESESYLFKSTALSIAVLRAKASFAAYKIRDQRPYLEKSITQLDLVSQLVAEIQTETDYTSTLFDKALNFHEYLGFGIQAAHLLYQITGEKQCLERAFKYFSRAKSGALRRQLRDNRAKNFANLPQEVILKERKIVSEIARLELNLTQLERSDHASLIRDSLFEARQELISFTRELESNYPKYYSLKYTQSRLSLSDIQSQIGSDTFLINFFVSEENSFAMGIAPDTVLLYALPNLASQKKVLSFREAIFSGDQESVLQLGQQLYESYLKPFEAHLSPSKSLIIVPDGFLTELPFEALQKDGEYLIASMDVSYRLLHRQKPNQIEPKRSSLSYHGFAPVVFDYSREVEVGISNSRVSLTALPQSEREIKTVYSMIKKSSSWFSSFLGEKSQIFLQEQASEYAFKNLSGKATSILHLATHSSSDVVNPLESRIYFHPDAGGGENNILFQGELFGLDLNHHLVVLSSCGSGTGKYVKGEGVLGLANAFFYGGAQNVVLTLWNVLDRSSSEVVVHFFDHYINEEMKLSAALSQAKRDMIQDPDFSAPVHWTAFLLYN